MPPLQQIISSLFGVWRLAHFDKGGLAFINGSMQGARQSFFAAVIVAPAYALMLSARFDHLQPGTDPVRFVAAETIAYVLSWVAYPFAMSSIARALERFDRYPGYISAYNWSLVLQNALVLPLVMLSVSGALPALLTQALWLVVIAGIAVYVWFIARAALDVPPLTAASMVTVDFVLSFLISGAADGLY